MVCPKHGFRRHRYKSALWADVSIRVCFEWTDKGPINAQIVDYHWGKKMKRVRPPVHPGEILKEEFLVPMGLSANKFAQESGLDGTRISQIIRGRRGITADTALVLA